MRGASEHRSGSPQTAGPAARVLGCVLGAIVALFACAPRARILTFAEYTRVEHPVPYVLDLRHDGGHLVYFGARHSHDPADPEMADIERRWDALRPTIAFNEGGDPPALPDRDAAIGRFGEAGLVRYLAARSGVEAQSLEPSRASEVAMLLRRYTAEQIKVFYVLRQVPEERDARSEEPLPAYVDRTLRYVGKTPALGGPPGTLAELEASRARLLPPVPSYADVPQAWFDPAPPKPIAYTNEMSRELAELRDEHMVEVLRGAMASGARVMAVVGASHAVMQEPALRAKGDHGP